MGADETCDGVDNKIVPGDETDASDLAMWYADADADTYGDPDTFQHPIVINQVVMSTTTATVTTLRHLHGLTQLKCVTA